MSQYRTIHVKMWGDERFRRLSRAQPNAQTLWTYLLTGEHTRGSPPGLFVAGEAMLAEALEWPVKDLRRCMDELRAQGLLRSDQGCRVVAIFHVIDHNPPQSLNTLKRWGRQFKDIPECRLKTEYAQYLRKFLAKSDALGDAFQHAFRDAFPHGTRAHARADLDLDLDHNLDLEKGDSRRAAREGRPTPPPPEMTVPELVESWNDICGSEGLPRVEVTSEERRRKTVSRLKTYPKMAFWEGVLNKIIARGDNGQYRSPFLMGQKRDWRATYDWLVANNTNALRIVEGHYDEGSETSRG